MTYANERFKEAVRLLLKRKIAYFRFFLLLWRFVFLKIVKTLFFIFYVYCEIKLKNGWFFDPLKKENNKILYFIILEQNFVVLSIKINNCHKSVIKILISFKILQREKKGSPRCTFTKQRMLISCFFAQGTSISSISCRNPNI